MTASANPGGGSGALKAHGAVLLRRPLRGCRRGSPRRKPTPSWAATKSRGRDAPAPRRFRKRLQTEGRGLVTPQPIIRGPGRRGVVSASRSGGGGRAGSEHPAAADLRAGAWRPSGPLRSLPCRFSWPWRGSRRWQGAWPRAVRVSDCWSGGPGRSGAASSASKMARGWGGRDPQTRPRPVTQGRTQPAGRGAEAGRARSPLHPRPPRPRGLLSWEQGPRFEALLCHPRDRGLPFAPPLPTSLGRLSRKRETPSPRIVARVGCFGGEGAPAHRRPDPLSLLDPRRVSTGRARAAGPTSPRRRGLRCGAGSRGPGRRGQSSVLAPEERHQKWVGKCSGLPAPPALMPTPALQ